MRLRDPRRRLYRRGQCRGLRQGRAPRQSRQGFDHRGVVDHVALCGAGDRGRREAKSIGVLDAPICRGRFAADEGTLLALVGGEADVVERGRAVYGTFCSDYAHLGNVGHGQVGKTMNNLLLWVNAVGLIEAGRLAETTGIDLVKLRDALMMSSGASDALKEWDMISFTWALKDMQVVAEMTDKAGLSLPITGAIKELVKEARRNQGGNPPNWTGKGPTKYSVSTEARPLPGLTPRRCEAPSRKHEAGPIPSKVAFALLRIRVVERATLSASRLVHRHGAAIDEQILADDEGQVVAYQEQDRLRGFHRLPRTP